MIYRLVIAAGAAYVSATGWLLSAEPAFSGDEVRKPPSMPGMELYDAAANVKQEVPNAYDTYFSELRRDTYFNISSALTKEAGLRAEFEKRARDASPLEEFRRALMIVDIGLSIYDSIDKIQSVSSAKDKIEKAEKAKLQQIKLKYSSGNDLKSEEPKAKSGAASQEGSNESILVESINNKSKPEELSRRIELLNKQVPSFQVLMSMSESELTHYFSDVKNTLKLFKEMDPTSADLFANTYRVTAGDIFTNEIPETVLGAALDSILLVLRPQTLNDGTLSGAGSRKNLIEALGPHLEHLSLWENLQKREAYLKIPYFQNLNEGPTIRSR